MVERLNRTVISVVEHLVDEEGRWEQQMVWAKLAYNSAVHAALSDGGEGLTPAEVHLGRRLQVPNEMVAVRKGKEGAGPQAKQELSGHGHTRRIWQRMQCMHGT